MAKTRISIIVASITACVLIGLSCSKNTQVAGWGSETTNGVSATICKSNGLPAAGAFVRMRKSDYVTSLPLLAGKRAVYDANAFTDEKGYFEIRGIDPGLYCIEVGDSNSALLLTCVVDSQSLPAVICDTLRSFAKANGFVAFANAPGKMLFVQVVGLERLVPVDSDGFFSINDLPAGRFILRIVATDGMQTTLIRSDSIIVVPGETANTMMPGWESFKKLYFNTTVGGAGVTGNVYNFPVLVRLTNNNFNFNEAQPSGQDLRFAKKDGTMLPYEIEQWDVAAKTGAIWVNVDTIFGNDSSRFMLMYWGASASVAPVSISNGKTVFDTANGNAGVWHMNQIGSGTVKDATSNQYNGVSNSMNASSAVQGIIGGGQGFDGSSGYLSFPGTANSKLNLPEKGLYSISAWVNSSKLDNNYHIIASKGNNQYSLEIMNSNSWEFAECRSVGGYTDVFSTAEINTWNYLVGVRNGGKEYLYVNGVCTDSTLTVMDTTFFRTTGDDFVIGKISNGATYYFSGIIDEVRVVNRPESSDWIKLCYMNQKAQDALVVFK